MKSYLDTEAGLEKVENKKEAYAEILKSYCKESISTKKLLKELLEQKDYENYRIQIHALKSISLSIGATELSEFAKKLEYASRDGEYEFVNNNNQIFLENYEEILKQAEEFLSKEVINIQNDNKIEEKEFSEQEIKENIKMALKCIDEFEADLAIEVLKKIKFIEKISECIELIDDFEYEEAKKMLGNFLVE